MCRCSSSIFGSFSGPVCRYEITSDSPSQEIPFVAEVTDEQRGRGEIRVKEGMHLDCSSPQYRFNLVAVRCNDQVKSERFVGQ